MRAALSQTEMRTGAPPPPQEALGAAIVKASDPPIAHDVEALVREGFARIQSLAGDVWTDFNAHDPGVTILETLCFALTDIAYRARHPIDQIIASSAAANGVEADQQPLFTGDQILTTAPVTEEDFRKLLSQATPEVKNAWVQPGAPGAEAVRAVLVQFYPAASAPARRAACAHIRKLLSANRPIGVDFTDVRELTEVPARLSAIIDIAPDANAEETLAAALFLGEMRFNPSPAIRNTDAMIAEGASPADVFDGPLLSRGMVDGASLRPLVSRMDAATLRHVMSEAPGVAAVEALSLSLTDLRGGAFVTTIDRTPDGLAGVRVRCAGRDIDYAAARVAEIFAELVDRRRLRFAYDANRIANSAYAQRRPEPARRNLSRYKSIQRFLPEVYGVGPYGAEGGLGVIDEAGEIAAQARQAQARQLKAYLLFFEQVLADMLAQLDFSSKLLSFAPLDRSYVAQPVTTGADDDPNGPPDIAPVLGARDPKDQCWFANYARGVAAITAEADNFEDRRRRALDHMLARFGASVPAAPTPRDGDIAAERRAGARALAVRRALLAETPYLSRKRALGCDLLAAEGLSGECQSMTAPERLIHLRSGEHVAATIVEHVLLRDARIGLGALQIDHDFRIERPRAVSMTHDDAAPPIHCVIRLAAEPTGPFFLETFVAQWLVHGDAEILRQPGGYDVTLRVAEPGVVTMEFIEPLASASAASDLLANLRAAARRRIDQARGGLAVRDALTPIALYGPPSRPVGGVADAAKRAFAEAEAAAFAASGVSVFLRAADASASSGGAGPPEATLRDRALAETIVAETLPAALTRSTYWLSREEAPQFDRDLAAWRSALAAVRRADEGEQNELTRVGLERAAGDASAVMLLRIRDAYNQMVLDRRALL